MDIVVRRMTEADVPRVAEIEAANFSMPWSEKAFFEQLNNQYAL